jgi:LPS O-antigen subunit length determinant protein (WzzB/FepE family)
MEQILMIYYFLGGVVVGIFIILLAYLLTRK